MQTHLEHVNQQMEAATFDHNQYTQKIASGVKCSTETRTDPKGDDKQDGDIERRAPISDQLLFHAEVLNRQQQGLRRRGAAAGATGRRQSARALIARPLTSAGQARPKEGTWVGAARCCFRLAGNSTRLDAGAAWCGRRGSHWLLLVEGESVRVL